jgi:hypothetical protein
LYSHSKSLEGRKRERTRRAKEEEDEEGGDYKKKIATVSRTTRLRSLFKKIGPIENE